MKIIPKQPTSLINHEHSFSFSLDRAAVCFFILGMFLAAMIFHYLGFFPTTA